MGSCLSDDVVWLDCSTMTPGVRSQFLAEQDILVDASTISTLGLLPMEAMAVGVAVITAKNGSADHAKNEENATDRGFVRSQGLFDATIRMIEDPGLRARVVHQAIIDSAKFYPERAAASIPGLFFPAQTDLLPILPL